MGFLALCNHLYSTVWIQAILVVVWNSSQLGMVGVGKILKFTINRCKIWIQLARLVGNSYLWDFLHNITTSIAQWNEKRDFFTENPIFDPFWSLWHFFDLWCTLKWVKNWNFIKISKIIIVFDDMNQKSSISAMNRQILGKNSIFDPF